MYFGKYSIFDIIPEGSFYFNHNIFPVLSPLVLKKRVNAEISRRRLLLLELYEDGKWPLAGRTFKDKEEEAAAFIDLLYNSNCYRNIVLGCINPGETYYHMGKEGSGITVNERGKTFYTHRDTQDDKNVYICLGYGQFIPEGSTEWSYVENVAFAPRETPIIRYLMLSTRAYMNLMASISSGDSQVVSLPYDNERNPDFWTPLDSFSEEDNQTDESNAGDDVCESDAGSESESDAGDIGDNVESTDTRITLFTSRPTSRDKIAHMLVYSILLFIVVCILSISTT